MEQQTLFSGREKQVIELLMQGRSNKQIALALGVSVRTVEFHLSNIYVKLGVTSRTEAALKLSENGLRESTGILEGERLRESAVDGIGEPADNGGTPFSQRRMPMKNLVTVIGGGLLTTALVAMLVLANLPVKGADVAPTVQASVTPELEQPTETTSPKGQLPANWQEMTYTNRLDSSDVDLTLKWFYIDSTRVSMEFSVSGFPVPEGYAPIRIINAITLQKADGSAIDLDFDGNAGGGGGGGGDEAVTINNGVFDEVFFYPIKNGEQITSQEEPFVFDVTVGGVPVYDEQGNSKNEILPSTTFHFEAKPSYVGSLTFVTQKTANIENKVVTFKRMEINPSSSVVTLCVFDPEGQQWLPTVHLLYKGNIFDPGFVGLTDTNSDPSKELCYRLEYSFQVDLADDPTIGMAVWVEKLTKDQPERLPNELISSAMQKLSAKGIEFAYMIKDHSAGIEILKKPEGLTETEALTMIQDALTEEALTSGVLVFDLK